MLKKIFIGLLGLILLLAISILFIAGMGASKFSETISIEPISVEIPTDSMAITRGMRFAGMYGCMDCHGESLSGTIMIDAPPFRVIPANLTTLQDKSSAEWEKIIRHGVTESGRRAVIMPVYHDMPDQDLGDLVAYINSLDVVNNDLPETELRLIGKIIAVIDEVSIYEPRKSDHNHTVSIERIVSLETGKNLARNLCQHCHRDDFGGGKAYIPGSPDVPALGNASDWNLDTFSAAIQTGKLPDGREMQPGHMPWTAFAHLTAEEVESLHLFIKSKLGESL